MEELLRDMEKLCKMNAIERAEWYHKGCEKPWLRINLPRDIEWEEQQVEEEELDFMRSKFFAEDYSTEDVLNY